MARRHQVLPFVSPAAATGHDVVDVLFGEGIAAILATKPIPQHHVSSSEAHCGMIATRIAVQSDNAWCANAPAQGADGVVVGAYVHRRPSREVVQVAAFIQYVRPLAVDQAEGVAHRADGHGLKPSAEDEHGEREHLAATALEEAKRPIVGPVGKPAVVGCSHLVVEAAHTSSTLFFVA